jgi:hypothetical protein
MLAAIFNRLWQSTAFAALAGLLTLALRKITRACVTAFGTLRPLNF